MTREQKAAKSARNLRSRYRSPESHAAYLKYQAEYRQRERDNRERED